MVYDEFKKNLIRELEWQKDYVILRERNEKPEMLFEIAGRDEKLYSRIVRVFEMTVLSHIEKLVKALCGEHGIKCESGRGKGADMFLESDGKIAAVDFKTSPMNFNYARLKYLIDNAKKFDGDFYTVFLLRDGLTTKESLKSFSRRVRYVSRDAEIKYMLFEEFMVKYFGQDEKTAFLQALKELKEEINEVIGYKITEICSDANKLKLKEELTEELKNFDYSAANQNGGITEAQFSAIVNRYKDGKLYEILLGGRDFADSFITSEWLYKKYSALGDLDNTYIIAGYLKSAEQLLWHLVRLYRNGDSFQYKTDSVDKKNKTLGTFEIFLKNPSNEKFFRDGFGDGKSDIIKFVTEKLSQWRVGYRNDYFHKSKLCGKDTVEQIRKDTICLYMLILGTVALDENTVNYLLG